METAERGDTAGDDSGETVETMAERGYRPRGGGGIEGSTGGDGRTRDRDTVGAAGWISTLGVSDTAWMFSVLQSIVSSNTFDLKHGPDTTRTRSLGAPQSTV